MVASSKIRDSVGIRHLMRLPSLLDTDTKRHDEPFGRMLTVSGMAVLVPVWLITRADEGAVIVLACVDRGREDYCGGGV